MNCKNCGRSLVRSRGRWQHEGFERYDFPCRNPQSATRIKPLVRRGISHLVCEPMYARIMPAERCIRCNTPTRYWLQPRNVPVCKECVLPRRNKNGVKRR